MSDTVQKTPVVIKARFSSLCPKCQHEWRAGELIQAEGRDRYGSQKWTHHICPR